MGKQAGDRRKKYEVKSKRENKTDRGKKHGRQRKILL